MGYPSTVDNGLVAPAIFCHAGIDNTRGMNSLSGSQGNVLWADVWLPAPVTVVQMRTAFSGTPTGNVDMGIYDSTGANGAPNNLLGHTGAIAATTGAFTQNLLTSLLLGPGLYWIAFLDTVADTLLLGTAASNGLGAVYKSNTGSQTVLPAVAGGVSHTNVWVGVYGLLQGSYS